MRDGVPRGSATTPARERASEQVARGGGGGVIEITQGAAAKLAAVLAQEGRPGDGLRVKVVGGGCSGLQYKLELDAPRPGDKVFGQDGAKVIVDRKSFLYLTGARLVYKDGLMDTGFQLDNPNVKQTCGCGASFTV